MYLAEHQGAMSSCLFICNSITYSLHEYRGINNIWLLYFIQNQSKMELFLQLNIMGNRMVMRSIESWLQIELCSAKNPYWSKKVSFTSKVRRARVLIRPEWENIKLEHRHYYYWTKDRQKIYDMSWRFSQVINSGNGECS